ncbi:Basal body-orientation factor 1 [Intoshia linei]|uniref:Basal body-orientation factor 1 n=1 Tax=Intoshia linei TaxID=1819745 RepID=A0A177B669_9BILA|nr:Basal body-orientation factor 1 [Intoshia linei]
MAKKKKKGKKKGKGKGGDVVKEISVKNMAEANSRIWEMRLEASNSYKKEYMKKAHDALNEKDHMCGIVKQSERDTIEVITYLKKKETLKDNEITSLNSTIKDIRVKHDEELQQISKDNESNTKEFKRIISEMSEEINIMKRELKSVKEFRSKRAYLQDSLDKIRTQLHENKSQYSSNIAKLEQKYFDEKMKLEQESNRKISELTETAHKEAVANLNKTTKSVFTENVRLNKELAEHVRSTQDLNSNVIRIEKENKIMKSNCKINAKIIKQKTQECLRLSMLQDDNDKKVELLEGALSKTVNMFNDRIKTLAKSKETSESKLQAQMSDYIYKIDKTTEKLAYTRKLARMILQQRSDLEIFFNDALNHIRSEIKLNQADYKIKAKKAFHFRMSQANRNKNTYPQIRTFTNNKCSTNSVYSDLKCAQNMSILKDGVRISDLTWEQKENVIGYLFYKINTKLPKNEKTKPLGEIQQNKIKMVPLDNETKLPTV